MGRRNRYCGLWSNCAEQGCHNDKFSGTDGGRVDVVGQERISNMNSIGKAKITESILGNTGVGFPAASGRISVALH